MGLARIGTPNRNVDESVYPDDLVRTTSSAIGEAEIFRFDLSDLQPSAFGGTVGQGLFKLFQDFLSNPDDIDVITQQMEDAAAEAYGRSRWRMPRPAALTGWSL